MGGGPFVIIPLGKCADNKLSHVRMYPSVAEVVRRLHCASHLRLFPVFLLISPISPGSCCTCSFAGFISMRTSRTVRFDARVYVFEIARCSAVRYGP